MSEGPDRDYYRSIQRGVTNPDNSISCGIPSPTALTHALIALAFMTEGVAAFTIPIYQYGAHGNPTGIEAQPIRARTESKLRAVDFRKRRRRPEPRVGRERSQSSAEPLPERKVTHRPLSLRFGARVGLHGGRGHYHREGNRKATSREGGGGLSRRKDVSFMACRSLVALESLQGRDCRRKEEAATLRRHGGCPVKPFGDHSSWSQERTRFSRGHLAQIR